MFLTWSSWFRATTLKIIRRNCCSSAPRSEAQRADRQEGLLVGVGAGLIEVEVLRATQGLHVQLRAGGIAVEPLRHEVAPPALLEQAASLISIPAARAICA